MADIKLLRNHGRDALETILNIPGNIKIIEKHIFDVSTGDGEHNIEYEYKRNLYQVIGDVMSKKKLEELLKNIKQKRIGWNHSSFDLARAQMDEQDDFIENPFEVEEGVIDCKCGSKRVFSYSKQSRSADEPMTTYAQCVQCNAKWQYSG